MDDEIDRMLQPGAIVPVDIRTTGMLVNEVARLRKALDEIANNTYGNYSELRETARRAVQR
jgi:hypothetical protein